jgi:hypothetical protein
VPALPSASSHSGVSSRCCRRGEITIRMTPQIDASIVEASEPSM